MTDASLSGIHWSIEFAMDFIAQMSMCPESTSVKEQINRIETVNACNHRKAIRT